MLSLLGTLIVGFIVGLIARALKPGDDKLGIVMTALLGVAGAFVANYAGTALGLYRYFVVVVLIASVVGAIGLLALYGLVKGRAGR